MDPNAGRKRKCGAGEQADDDEFLKLSLAPPTERPRPPAQAPTPAASSSQPTPALPAQHMMRSISAPSQQPARTSQPIRKARKQVKSDEEDMMDPPFPWATNRCARVHRLNYLLDRGISKISGEVQCKYQQCEKRATVTYDLLEKFKEVANLMTSRREDMRERALPEWMNPKFPACQACGKPDCMRPVMPENMSQINWLFLLLGQTLGYCNLKQLRFFCEYTKNHRTGAKDRLVFLAYLALCKQVDPTGPFEY